MVELSEKDEEYLNSLLRQGKKIDAVIFVKDKKGMTLKEAKEYVDKKINNVNNECYEENISISKLPLKLSLYHINYLSIFGLLLLHLML